MAYTGPIPPTPTATSTDVQWQNWWAYQTVVGNMRYEDERAATAIRDARIRSEDVERTTRLDARDVAALKLAAERAVITDKQHAEKIAAETRCAEAQVKLAAAQAETARVLALIHTTPPAEAPAKPWTDEQLVRAFMLEMAGTVPTGTVAMQRAQAYAAILRFNFEAPAAITGVQNAKSSR